MNRISLAFGLLVLSCGVQGMAQSRPDVEAPGRPEQAAASGPRHFITRHTGTFGGTVVHYTATAADLPLENDNGQLIGYVFSFAYTRDDVKDPASRPVMFIFNGGPGSSSLWTHVGGFGPKRVPIAGPEDTTIHFPAAIDNPSSLLDVADLVFIDPIGTGFSRPAEAGKLEQFFDVRADAATTAEFIQRWLAQSNRWTSPKYMLGESYGTTRAALTAKYLMGGVDSGHLPLIQMNGIVLLGTALTLGVPQNDMAYADALPSLAATAWYHGKLDRGGRSLENFVAEVDRYAGGEYLAALYAGSRLTAQQRQDVATQLHRYTGLSSSFILRHDLRVDPHDFTAELLADEGKFISLADGRYAGATPRPPLDPVGDDAGIARTGASLVPGFLAYLRSDLGVTLDTPYEITNFVANGQWKPLPESYNLAIELGRAMSQNPALRVFVGQGYFDLTTPTGAAKDALAHGGVPLDRVELVQYESGHLIYAVASQLQKLSADLRVFVTETSEAHRK